MTNPTIIRVLDAQNKEDREYAEKYLIGCVVGYDDRKCMAGYPNVLDGVSDGFNIGQYSWRYIWEFSNSRSQKNHSQHTCSNCSKKIAQSYGVVGEPTPPQYCSECFLAKSTPKKKQPPFYCAVNIDEVPADAVGKELELSNGTTWIKTILKSVDNSMSINPPFVFLCSDGMGWAFMRPMQPKPVKRMTIAEAGEAIIKHTTVKDLVISSYDSVKKVFYLSSENWNFKKHFSIKGMEKELSEKLNCEVVIDE